MIMITLECIQAFGRHVPGDQIVIPEGVFDTWYWRQVVEEAPVIDIPVEAVFIEDAPPETVPEQAPTIPNEDE